MIDFEHVYKTYETHNLSLIHISEPTRRTPISYAVFCLKKKKPKRQAENSYADYCFKSKKHGHE